MTTEPETERRVYPRENSKHWIGVSAEDIPAGWIDDMVKRLFDELNRQMIRAEKASSQESDKKDHNGKFQDDPDAREKNGRILARLQTQLERLTAMEMDRASLRATKSTRTPTETRAAIRRKVLAAIDAGRIRNGDGESR
ncbi:MAG TPA: hypothetical protein VJ476_07640 [Rhizomicrobium sp.]|nr:hypothetical protein [Rhizomicrobium sp.]